MLLQASVESSAPTNAASLQAFSSQSNGHWAVVLAGGDGTRLQPLTFEISGDARPKQFCKLMGEESLLRQTGRRITPLFTRDRQVYIVTRAHEVFYRDELLFSNSTWVLEQPCNRGTAAAIAVAASWLLSREADPLVAFFPSDHHYADENAFLRAVNSALEYSRQHPQKIVLLAAEPYYPEVEYGWIEPGAIVSDVPTGQLLGVARFWEKPSLPLARTLFQRRCLWNTFVTIGRAATFLALLRAQVPYLTTSIARALSNNRLGDSYRDLPSVDISRQVFRPQPNKLLAFRDTHSGWSDLGTPKRVLDTLARSEMKPEWVTRLPILQAPLQPAEERTFLPAS